MRCDKWEPAYIKGKRSKIFAYGKFGIYFIREIESKQIRYIGMSKYSIAKALYRHFNKWNDVPQRVVFNNKEDYEVRVIVLPIHLVSIYEKRLIRYFRLGNNHELYNDLKETIDQNEFIHEYELEEVPF